MGRRFCNSESISDLLTVIAIYCDGIPMAVEILFDFGFRPDIGRYCFHNSLLHLYGTSARWLTRGARLPAFCRRMKSFYQPHGIFSRRFHTSGRNNTLSSAAVSSGRHLLKPNMMSSHSRLSSTWVISLYKARLRARPHAASFTSFRKHKENATFDIFISHLHMRDDWAILIYFDYFLRH